MPHEHGLAALPKFRRALALWLPRLAEARAPIEMFVELHPGEPLGLLDVEFRAGVHSSGESWVLDLEEHLTADELAARVAADLDAELARLGRALVRARRHSARRRGEDADECDFGGPVS